MKTMYIYLFWYIVFGLMFMYDFTYDRDVYTWFWLTFALIYLALFTKEYYYE